MAKSTESESSFNPIAVFVVTLLSLVLVIIIASAVFPKIFAKFGITLFSNSQTGVFGDCYYKAGQSDPVCRSDRSSKSKTKRPAHAESRIGSYAKKGSTKKPSIGQFKLSD